MPIFPSIVLVFLIQLFILPIFHDSSVLYFSNMFDGETKIIVTALTVILIAYFFDAANIVFIRLFEGYYFQNQFPFDMLRKRKQAFVANMLKDIQNYERERKKFIDAAEADNNGVSKLQKYKKADFYADLIYEHRQKISYNYPDKPQYVLASDFGNVIAAAEQYPKKIFGMNSVVLWPFLRPILTEKDYAQYLVREKAVMDFLINLTIVFAL